jgi:L-alanine-DL-glutamate epimerase-like enolase superfamily enzyme
LRVTRLEARLLDVALPLEFEGGTYSITRRSTVQVRLSTDAGLSANICVGNEDHYSDYFFSVLRGPFQDILRRHDALETELIWREMVGHATGYVDKAEIMKAISTVDIALWDLKGRAAGLPLWKLLGGYRNRVPLIAIAGYYEAGDGYDQIAREVERLRSYGVAGVKWKVGRRSLEVDAGRIASVRKAAGDSFVIIADSNMAWSPEDAIQFTELIEPYEVTWLEEPVHWTQQHGGLRRVRAGGHLAIAAGQSETSVFDCGWLLDEGAVDVLNLCCTRGGGITGWIKLAGRAALSGVRMANVGEPHIAGHLMAAFANGTFAECYADQRRDPFWETLYKDRPKIDGGFLVLPHSPGLGVSIDEVVADRYAAGPWQ